MSSDGRSIGSIAPNSQGIPSPSFSVILHTFEHRGFLEPTLHSILTQDFDCDRIELIIVDSSIGALEANRELLTKLSERVRLRMIKPCTREFGPARKIGLTAASNSIVTFLDDDDVWEKDRLSRIAQVYMTHPGLGYYHNRCSYIDDRGVAIPESIARRRLRHFSLTSQSKPIYFQGERIPFAIKGIGKFGPDFNTSSIAISSSVARKCIELFDRVSAHDDTVYFSVAMKLETGIFLDSHRLTRYRIHASNRSRPIDWRYSSKDIQAAVGSVSFLLSALNPAPKSFLEKYLRREQRYLSVLSDAMSINRQRFVVMRNLCALVPVITFYDPIMNTLALCLGLSYLCFPITASSKLVRRSGVFHAG